MQQASIFVLNLTEKGAAFGHLIETGEAVFIPAKVMAASKAVELGTYTAKLIPNVYRDDVPFMAIFMFRLDEAQPDGSHDLPDFITNAQSALH